MENTNCGIYKITNNINGHSYIGKSTNISHRWIEHKCHSKTDDCALYRAMRKYGVENFSFEVIQYALPDELEELEQYYIELYNTYHGREGYNETAGGDGRLKHDYSKIVELWNQGYLCQDIEIILGCCDKVINNALHSYGITDEEISKQARAKKAISITAYDPKTKKPLKIFHSLCAINKFFKDEHAGSRILNSLNEPLYHRHVGFRWAYTKDEDYKLPILSDEEFLSHQKKCKIAPMSEEAKVRLSQERRTVERPSRDELKQMIRTMPFTHIGDKYNLCDNSIRKWCLAYNLPKTKKEINKYTDEEWEKI